MGITSDKIKNGDFNFNKTYSSNVISSAYEEILYVPSNTILNPIIKEVIINTYERFYDEKIDNKQDKK